MRLKALCLIGALCVLGMPTSARSMPEQADRQAAAGAQQATQAAAHTCSPGYYWEPDGYAPHGKFRPAHCAFRW